MEGQSPHGHKRRAEDELANDQRLIKRFNLLNLERNGKLYIPMDRTVAAYSQQPNVDGDSMLLDDTKDKVYIYNLEDELRGIDEEEGKFIFLPDIERKLTKIPKSVLTSTNQPLANQEMVLYTVPSSLTVPEEKDNVRKAIIETRERARQKQIEDARAVQSNTDIQSVNICAGQVGHHLANTGDFKDDEDAMDIG